MGLVPRRFASGPNKCGSWCAITGSATARPGTPKRASGLGTWTRFLQCWMPTAFPNWRRDWASGRVCSKWCWLIVMVHRRYCARDSCLRVWCWAIPPSCVPAMVSVLGATCTSMPPTWCAHHRVTSVCCEIGRRRLRVRATPWKIAWSCRRRLKSPSGKATSSA